MAKESTISRIQQHLDSIISYLNPLMPLANCHMVEFFTQNHWERFIPWSLRVTLEKWKINDAVERFWNVAESCKPDFDCDLGKWIETSRANCISLNNEYCISKEQLQNHIKQCGGNMKAEIKIMEFMNSKKSYEVQTLSNLLASLHTACSATCCIEAGGGRGHLPIALSLGYGIPCLTIDCDEKTINSASQRIQLIQKQWHAIAKKVKSDNEEQLPVHMNRDLHRFASAFMTRHTDLTAIVRDKFPEYSNEDIKLLLTGLHTCGNLGPDSFRIFTGQPSVAAVLNVPCCYHLLTEVVDEDLFDVFQKGYGDCEEAGQGFPMSEYLRGFNLGRNARMLAAQSIDRVVHSKQLPSKSLLYRALLQVIIKKHSPDFPLVDGKLKRITAKCQSFEQYFKMADEILNLELFERLPSETIKDFCSDLESQWKKVVLFYLMRLCLAQVIESVILLDRLLYLLENGFEKVYLVKLFDPVLSPRCHGIVALR